MYWWGKRALIFGSALSFVAWFIGVLSEFPSGSNGIKLADVPVLVFRPDEKTSGWRAPSQFPKMVCMEKLCPVWPVEVNCYNEGLDKVGKKIKV